jgi:hypothetical protein
LQPFDFHPKTTAIGHDESKIADLRNIEPRIVHLVDDAESQRKPDARRTERAADDVFGAAAPRRRDTWTAGCASFGFSA